jgi:predicted ABC-type sugar transport system permease subunit
VSRLCRLAGPASEIVTVTGALVSMTGICMGGRVYPWQMVTMDAVLITWVLLVRWYRRRADGSRL